MPMMFEQQPRESNKAFAAFKAYLDMGPERSIAGVSQTLAKSIPFLKTWSAKFDWPEWVPWLLQALQQEPDLGVFDEGCAALGRLEIRSAREALLKLAALRTDPDRQLADRRDDQ